MERKKTTKNIGKLSGKTLVFGGVYGNLQSLHKMQDIASKLNIPASNIICTGDVVGYCAQPEEVVQTMRKWGIHHIAGNVEIQLRDGKDDCGCDFKKGSRCDGFSNLWYPFTKINLSQSSVDWMNTLPDFLRFTFANKQGMVLHGSYHETAEYIFQSTAWKIKKDNMKSAEVDLVLAGHCGLPFSQINDNAYWLNAGVIGMPANDGNTHVWYLILDTNEKGELVFAHHTFEYDHLKASNLMIEENLPEQYALTLKTGLWDNCEVLPEEETASLGKKIKL